MKESDNGFEVDGDIKGFTPTDEEIEELLKKYSHDITIVVFMGSVDDAPSFGFKVAGKDERTLHSGTHVANIFMRFLKNQFDQYVEEGNEES